MDEKEIKTKDELKKLSGKRVTVLCNFEKLKHNKKEYWNIIPEEENNEFSGKAALEVILLDKWAFSSTESEIDGWRNYEAVIVKGIEIIDFSCVGFNFMDDGIHVHSDEEWGFPLLSLKSSKIFADDVDVVFVEYLKHELRNFRLAKFYFFQIEHEDRILEEKEIADGKSKGKKKKGNMFIYIYKVLTGLIVIFLIYALIEGFYDTSFKKLLAGLAYLYILLKNNGLIISHSLQEIKLLNAKYFIEIKSLLRGTNISYDNEAINEAENKLVKTTKYSYVNLVLDGFLQIYIIYILFFS